MKNASRGRPELGINAFFEKRLGAKLVNPRWSWGAHDPLTRSVFLRVWDAHRETIDGHEAYRVEYPDYHRDKKSSTRVAAKNERARHLEMAKNGAQLFGVVCFAVDDNAAVRSIKTYDDRELIVFERIIDWNGARWGVVGQRISADGIAQRPVAWSDEAADIEAVRHDCAIDRTTRDALVDARLGQGVFREKVLKLWGGACALTGCSFGPLLRASHIKPWRESINDERLNPRNGLPLAAHVDALFDRGFISFTDRGELMVSSRLPGDALALIGSARALRRQPTDDEKRFLAHHRECCFRR